MLKKNIGTPGRILRASIGVLLLVYAGYQNSWPAFAFALFTFYEAFAGWCIIYSLLGKNSCPKD